MKYNYVFFLSIHHNLRGSNPKAYDNLAASELGGLDHVRVLSGALSYAPHIVRLVFALHTSVKINRFYELPFKSAWYNWYFSNDFEEKKPFCFVFPPSIYDKKGYLEYLREKYQDAKFVMVIRDRLDKQPRLYPEFPLDAFKDDFDLVLSYNMLDAEDYGLLHFDSYASWVPVSRDADYPLSDVFFAGVAKDRLDLLIQTYKRLTNSGLKCEFFITGVDKGKQVLLPGITYSTKPMLYYDMLYRSVNSRCILEITQGGTLGFTSRFFEAIMYNKKLITNNPAVLTTRFYRPEHISHFRSPCEINPSFVQEGPDTVAYDYRGEYSPTRMIQLIEEQFAPAAVQPAQNMGTVEHVKGESLSSDR